jgi:hypothetical protein
MNVGIPIDPRWDLCYYKFKLGGIVYARQDS